MIERRHELEELRNVVRNYPLFPGDTISHETARRCAAAGWIVRNFGGDWIPTAEGLRELARAEAQSELTKKGDTP